MKLPSRKFSLDRGPVKCFDQYFLNDLQVSFALLPKKKKKTKFMTGIAAAAAKSLQSCPTLCDPRDGSPAGSPIPGILRGRTLEWVAISFYNT